MKHFSVIIHIEYDFMRKRDETHLITKRFRLIACLDFSTMENSFEDDTKMIMFN